MKQEICKTRQIILFSLIALASYLDNPNFFGTGSKVRFHSEKAGAVLYVKIFSQVAVNVADFLYCTEEVLVIIDILTKIKFVNLITQKVFSNSTLTSCDLRVFCHLDFADNLPSLHTAGLFSYENLQKMQEHAF